VIENIYTQGIEKGIVNTMYKQPEAELRRGQSILTTGEDRRRGIVNTNTRTLNCGVDSLY